ncbi:MAG: tetratricopeptide repeat protein [Ancalomicrobiaceae bacterium]|nr:tetratricopeptide repeat protein [Ancalomicrobiaceae bacterium]
MTVFSTKRGQARRPALFRIATVAALGFGSCILSAEAGARTARAPYDSDSSPQFSGNFLAAQLAGKQHDIGAAATYYRNALAADPQNPLLVQQAFQMLLADGRIKDALPLADKILTRDKANHLARLALGIDAFKRGNFERARSNFAQMQTRESPNMTATILDLTATILTAWSHAGQEDADTAFKVVDRLKGPDWYEVFKNYHSGLIAEMTGRKGDAAKRLAAAYKGDPNGLRVVDAEARDLARSGHRDDALGVLATFDKTTPDHPLILDLKSEIETGRTPQLSIQSAQAGAAELLFGIGAAIGREGGEEVAAVYLQLALWLDAKAELPLINLASVQGQLKHYDKAVELLEQIPPSSKLRPMVDIQIGRYYAVLEKYDLAKERLSGLVKRNPKDIEAVMALGDVLRNNKEFAQAADVYTQAINALPKPAKTDWALFYYRAICFERVKQWPKAEADFFKAIDLNPDEAHVLNYLGYSWIDMGMNLDKGLSYVQKAVDLRPDDGYIVDSLGWAYYRLGRYDDAVREMERAVLLKPDDPVINDHLGDGYWRVGRKLEATFQWAHARDLKPEADDLAKIEKKLKEGMKDAPGTPSAQAEVPAPVSQPSPKPVKSQDSLPASPSTDAPAAPAAPATPPAPATPTDTAPAAPSQPDAPKPTQP